MQSLEREMRKILSTVLYRNQFPLNDLITSQVNTYLDLLKAQRWIYDYKVVCDASNNPPSSNQLNVDVAIRPTLLPSYIQLSATLPAQDDDWWKFAPPPFEGSGRDVVSDS